MHISYFALFIILFLALAVGYIVAIIMVGAGRDSDAEISQLRAEIDIIDVMVGSLAKKVDNERLTRKLLERRKEAVFLLDERLYGTDMALERERKRNEVMG